MKYLLANGARANAGDSNGDTALHWAAFKGQAQSVFAILNAALNSDVRSPTDPHSQNADGGTALHSAANHGDVATGEILLEFGASVKAIRDLLLDSVKSCFPTMFANNLISPDVTILPSIGLLVSSTKR